MKKKIEGDYVTYTPKPITIHADVSHHHTMEMISAAVKRDYYEMLSKGSQQMLLKALLEKEIEGIP